MPYRFAPLKLSLIAAAILTTGCMEEKLVDVSSQDKYRHLIGSKFEVIGRVDAYGIRDHSGAPADYVTLMPPPGIGGSQIAFVRSVPSGSKVTVTKVLKTNHVFDPDKTLLVHLEALQEPIT